MTNLTHTTASAALRELSPAESLAVSGGMGGCHPGPYATGGNPPTPSPTHGVPIPPPVWLGPGSTQPPLNIYLF
ncbi:MAG: hypothetical protein F4171_12855 [Gammaproteobacteria bacterium]|nr:hypothetical protein [Gammaproteobacteria bacterium]